MISTNQCLLMKLQWSPKLRLGLLDHVCENESEKTFKFAIVNIIILNPLLLPLLFFQYFSLQLIIQHLSFPVLVVNLQLHSELGSKNLKLIIKEMTLFSPDLLLLI